MGFPTVDLAEPFEGVDAESTANLLKRLNKNTLGRLFRVPECSANLFEGPSGQASEEHVGLPSGQRSTVKHILTLDLEKHIGGNGNHTFGVPAFAFLRQHPLLAEALLIVEWTLEAVLAEGEQGFGNK